MSKVHKNAEVIKAWADGKVIQWFDPHSAKWTDFDRIFHYGPWLGLDDAWRIKPEPKKGWVRVAEHGEGGRRWVVRWSDHDGKTEAEIESRTGLVRWLSPRLDFDYPEDYEGGA